MVSLYSLFCVVPSLVSGHNSYHFIHVWVKIDLNQTVTVTICWYMQLAANLRKQKALCLYRCAGKRTRAVVSPRASMGSRGQVQSNRLWCWDWSQNTNICSDTSLIKLWCIMDIQNKELYMKQAYCWVSHDPYYITAVNCWAVICEWLESWCGPLFSIFHSRYMIL